MLTIKGTEKELEEMINSWLPNSGFPAVRDMVSAQKNGLLHSLKGLQFEIEVEQEPTVGLFVGGTRYGVAGEETDIIDDDGAVVLVGDVVTIAWTCEGTQFAEIRPVLKGHKRTGESVFFVGGFFKYFAEEESVPDVKLKVVIPYNEVPCGMIIGNVKYVKS